MAYQKNTYFFQSLIFFFIVSGGLRNNCFGQEDQFARIGAQRYNLRTNLLSEPLPPVLPEKYLPVGIDKSLIFKPHQEISTKEELAAELMVLKKQFAPFMQNLAPLLPNYRERILLSEMKWRVETDKDRSDFLLTLQGEGNWKNVNIPHYGPPLGNAVSYYFKEVYLTADMIRKGALYLCFKGVDYRSSVFFNGTYCGSHEGFFAPFEFEVFRYAKVGLNKILVKVENEPTTTGSSDENKNHVVGNKIYASGGLGYDEPEVGWHVCPPAMGIFQDCYLEARSPLNINDIFVRPLPEQSKAEAWIEINNSSSKPKEVKLLLSLYGKNFADTIFENREYVPATTFVPGVGDLAKPTDWQNKILHMEYGVNYIRVPFELKDFRQWGITEPWLYHLQVKLNIGKDKVADALSQNFGMRSFVMDTINIPRGRMYLNGKLIRLRGANSMGFEQRDVYTKNWNQLQDDILLAKLCNMNYLRFTQRPVQSEVYDYCDQLGMLNQTDFPLFAGIRRNQFAQAIKQVEEMERLVRSHPSTIMVTYINERSPNAEGSPQRSLNTSEEYYQLFKAMDQAVLLSNPDRVIKAGDGDYDPPSPGLPDSHCYNTWYNGHGLGLGKMHKGYWQPVKPGWLYGCGEFGAEGLDPLNVMQKYYPKNWMPQTPEEEKSWSANRIAMSQTNQFHYMWFNTQNSLKEWIDESQNFQAWATKFVTESFRRDSRMVSSAIHLFIDAWPAGWMKTIMDVDRQPKKAFFAYRKALSPLMVSLRTDRFSWFSGEKATIEAWVCNDRNEVPPNCTLRYEIKINGKSLVNQHSEAAIPENSAAFQGYLSFDVPKINQRTKAIVRLGIFNNQGICINSSNLELDLFPKSENMLKKVFVIGSTGGKATQLASETGCTIVRDMNLANAILVDDFARFSLIAEQVEDFVNKGGRVIFLELPAGSYSFGGTTVNVSKTIMGDYFFAQITPELLKDKRFQSKDFFLWYDQKAGYINPIVANIFKADGWKPLLTSGLCNWGKEDPSGYSVVGEKRSGKGTYYISEIMLSGRVKENPAGWLLFNRMVND